MYLRCEHGPHVMVKEKSIKQFLTLRWWRHISNKALVDCSGRVECVFFYLAVELRHRVQTLETEGLKNPKDKQIFKILPLNKQCNLFDHDHTIKRKLGCASIREALTTCIRACNETVITVSQRKREKCMTINDATVDK